MIGHFLKIQEIRYGEVFRYELDCDEALLPYLIPRMTLQPLFENIFSMLSPMVRRDPCQGRGGSR